MTRADMIYRHGSFSAGLRAAGYEVRSGTPEGRPGDVMLCWNRYGGYHDLATKFERDGGTVIVAENGYLAEGGASPHSMSVRTVYALARGDHNGRGDWYSAGPERWDALGVDLKPWRADGGHVLVCPNRSFDCPDTMMPPNWGNEVVDRLRKLTKREVRLRPHPGNSPPKKALAADLEGAWCAVIWQSSAGVHALVAGIPVICCSPAWICKGAAGADLREIENPPMTDRLPVMHRLAWAQWHLNEIQDGTAFKRLLA